MWADRWKFKEGSKKKKMLQIKTPVTDIRNSSYRLVSRLGMAKERISELEDIGTEPLKIKRWGWQKLKKRTEYLRTVAQIQKIYIGIIGLIIIV